MYYEKWVGRHASFPPRRSGNISDHWVRSIFHLTPFNSTQMFGRVPNTLVQSEPWGLTYLNRLMNKRMITSIEFHELLETCVKLQFKPRKQTQTDR